MKSRAVFTLFALLFLTAFPLRAEDSAGKAPALAKELWQASGGENWSKVKELQFTFVVEQDGKELIAAQHDWNIAAQTDHVRWKGKDVTVNLAAPAQDEESKAAYARWVNDSYWLLAPLKILDPGVTVTAEGSKEMDGLTSDVLHVRFAQVGLTPGDQYMLYVDPQTKLVRSWDYRPNAETNMHGTWEKYEKFGGLTLATEHKFGERMIRFTDVKATMAE